MFKRTERRIVAAIIAATVLFMNILLLVIYASSYQSLKIENKKLLSRHVEVFYDDERGAPGGGKDDRPDGPGMTGKDGEKGPGEPEYDLSTFYNVAYMKDGRVVVKNGNSSVMSDSELKEMAEEILASGKKFGKVNGLMYMVDERDDYTLVAFLDNTLSDNNLRMLLKNLLIVGLASVVVIFFLSIIISKKIVKPLEENDRRQKQFVSDAGHELKTPVSVIGTNTELLLRDVGDNEWLSNIIYETERMGTLVKELLELSRAENAEVVKEDLDFSRIVIGEELPFESVAFEKGQTLICDVDDGIFVEGNGNQLKQLTSILIDNAIRHGDSGKEIELSLKKDHKTASLSVTNYAEEIPEDKLEHLFERFYRVDEARGGEGGSGRAADRHGPPLHQAGRHRRAGACAPSPIRRRDR